MAADERSKESEKTSAIRIKSLWLAPNTATQQEMGYQMALEQALACQSSEQPDQSNISEQLAMACGILIDDRTKGVTYAYALLDDATHTDRLIAHLLYLEQHATDTLLEERLRSETDMPLEEIYARFVHLVQHGPRALFLTVAHFDTTAHKSTIRPCCVSTNSLDERLGGVRHVLDRVSTVRDALRAINVRWLAPPTGIVAQLMFDARPLDTWLAYACCVLSASSDERVWRAGSALLIERPPTRNERISNPQIRDWTRHTLTIFEDTGALVAHRYACQMRRGLREALDKHKSDDTSITLVIRGARAYEWLACDVPVAERTHLVHFVGTLGAAVEFLSTTASTRPPSPPLPPAADE